MRIRSWLFMGIGYLAGTKAGRERFDELKDTLTEFAHSDLVAEALGRTRESFGLAGGEDTEAEIHLPEEDDDEVLLDEPEDVHEDASA
jgi:hypothetical protein